MLTSVSVLVLIIAYMARCDTKPGAVLGLVKCPVKLDHKAPLSELMILVSMQAQF